MRRVVVTGLGIVSSIGNNADEVLTSLREGRSGITANEDMKEHGFRSQIAGAIDLDIKAHVDKRTLRFMGPGAAYAYLAMEQAISDSGLEEKDVIKRRIEEAARFVPLENLCLSPQCGFASTEEGNLLAETEQWAKLALVVDTARKVWGGV